jgi:hypothetical protein
VQFTNTKLETNIIIDTNASFSSAEAFLRYQLPVTLGSRARTFPSTCVRARALRFKSINKHQFVIRFVCVQSGVVSVKSGTIYSLVAASLWQQERRTNNKHGKGTVSELTGIATALEAYSCLPPVNLLLHLRGKKSVISIFFAFQTGSS